MAADLLIVGADLGLPAAGELRLGVRDGRAQITELGEQLDREGAVVLDAAGAAVLPGFTDHHLHLHALAVAGTSVRCGPPAVTGPDGLGRVLRGAAADRHGWIRGIGYIESVAGDLDRRRLDAIDDHRPIRVQHRSGALWMLNSAALAAIGADTAAHPGIERDVRGQPTGRLWRADDWLRTQLPTTGPPPLTEVGARLRGYGIVEVTDATPDLDDVAIGHIVGEVDAGCLAGRVQLLGVPLGRTVDHPRVRVGPYKIVLADSEVPDLDALIDRIRAAHGSGRSVAVHCVSEVGFALLTAAWNETGVRPGDRIEHAAMVPAASCRDLAARGIRVVTQPGFLPDRGDDFLDGTDLAAHPDLYRCGSLVRAGVPVALSSDAPYGPLNPWVSVAAAVERRTAAGRRVGDSGEALAPAEALRLHQAPAADPGGAPRRIAVGEPADLLIADRSRAAVLDDPGDVRVVQTVIDGRVSDG